MKFTFLLFILYLKLKKAAKKDPEFQEYIKKEKTKVLIKTADGKRGRMFIFDNGKFSSVPGGDQKDLTWLWSGRMPIPLSKLWHRRILMNPRKLHTMEELFLKAMPIRRSGLREQRHL